MSADPAAARDPLAAPAALSEPVTLPEALTLLLPPEYVERRPQPLQTESLSGASHA